MDYLPIFIALSLLAEFLGTIGGFGSSVFFVPIANFFLDFESVLGITALFHLASNVSKIALFRKGLDWPTIFKIGIPAVVMVIVGAWMSAWFPKTYLSLSLAIFLILLSSTFLIKKNLVIQPSVRNGVIGGAASGVFAGLLGTGGAIRGITLAAFNLEKEVFIATSAVIDLGIDLSRSVVYFYNGYMHKHDLYLVPILLVISIVGTYLGKITLKRVSQERFRQLVLSLILIVGILGLLQYLFGWTLIK